MKLWMYLKENETNFEFNLIARVIPDLLFAFFWRDIYTGYFSCDVPKCTGLLFLDWLV